MEIIRTDDIDFIIHSSMAKFRAETLLTKEPRTLEEIDRLKPGDVLYDIGASTGPYTLYAAKRGILVHAFEKDANDLHTNVDLNHFKELVTIHAGILRSLDELNLPSATMIKLDVDGGELEILQNSPIAVTQAKTVQIEERASNEQDVKTFMQQLGFVLDYRVRLNYNTKEFNAVYRKDY